MYCVRTELLLLAQTIQNRPDSRESAAAIAETKRLNGTLDRLVGISEALEEEGVN